jgi:CheY-like chemotaxis protein/two-component sensor histidine kinase
MSRLLEDLLDVSRLTRNRIELRRERLEIASAVAQAIETTQPLIEAQRHTLDVELPDEPLAVHGDPARLTQVFANLLNNAAKYSDRGSRIALRVARDGHHVCIGVRDNGIGIEPAQLDRVFDMFAQLEPAIERSAGGLGIGLALARGLVELHGGRMEARSDGLRRGSEFVVRLPLADAPRAAEPRPRAAADAPAALPARRLLVVDDNVDAAQTLAAMLTMHGQEVQTAFGSIEALRIAEQWQPEVAVLDIGMPVLNGYELCSRLRELYPANRQPLLIACTGWGQDSDREQARDAGFDHHLVKPIDPRALLRMLSERSAGAPPH